MSKHTPTPWTTSQWIDQPGNRIKPMIAAKGVTVAITHPAPICQTEECEANALHIVRCVNYHDRLVEALEAAMDYIDKSPCDPDIFLDQIEAHMKLCDIDPKALLSELSAHNGEGGE